LERVPQAAGNCGVPHLRADRYLAFRDRLRSSEEDRTAYERLKRERATRDWAEIGLYADAKGLLIETILARAGGPGR
jgi:GrpB-like predicted nucleotidyltransferase (UPF0157 family)